MVIPIPAVITAGDMFTWTAGPTTDEFKNVLDANTWDLTFYFRGPGTGFNVAGSDEGDGTWQFLMQSPDTISIAPGDYYWQAKAAKKEATDVLILCSGKLTVKANLTTATTVYDGRSQAKTDLDAVQAAMRAIISGGAVKAYTIGIRSLTKMDMSDLLVLESRLKLQVAREDQSEKVRQGFGNPNAVFTRFTKR